MSFCRITGKSRGLPKPNYFPLLPPISPADAKRFCRITNKSQGLPGHHFIPALLAAKGLRAHCRVTGKSEGQAPHHFPNIDSSLKVHDIIPGYKYVFPKFDEEKKLQQRLLSLMSTKTIPGESNAKYVYTVEERLTGLVIPAGLEAAVRDGDIRDVMLDKEKDTMLVKMHHGPSVTIDLTGLAFEEGMVLWDGLGPSQNVIKQWEKEEKEMELRKKKRQEGLHKRKQIFEDKERAADEEESEVAKIKDARKSKIVKLKMGGNAGGTVDVVLDSGPMQPEDRLNGLSSEPVFGHIVQTATAVEFFPGESILNLPEGKVVPGRLVRNAEGIKFVPGIMSEDKFIPGQVVMTNSGEQFVPGQVVDTRHGQKFVPGHVVDTVSGPKFVPGQTIETEDGPQFVPGQIIETKAGPTFIPGQIIVTDDEPRFVPGRVVETAEGPRFVPGRVIESGNQVTFVSGQVVETSEGLKFVAPDLEDMPEGGHEFSVQGFEVSPEELKLLRPAASCDAATGVFTVDSRMLRQLSEAGMAVGRQVPAKLPEVDIRPLPVVVEKLKLNGAHALKMSHLMTVLSQVAVKISQRSDLCASDIPLDDDLGDKILCAVKKDKDLGKYLQAIVASSVVAAKSNFNEESLITAVSSALESVLASQFDSDLTKESILTVIKEAVESRLPCGQENLLVDIASVMESEMKAKVENLISEQSVLTILASVLDDNLDKDNGTNTKAELLQAVKSAMDKERFLLCKEKVNKESFLQIMSSVMDSEIVEETSDLLSKEALLQEISLEINNDEASENEWVFVEENVLSIIKSAIEKEVSAKGVTLNNGSLPAAIMNSIKREICRNQECNLTEEKLLACIASVIVNDLPEEIVTGVTKQNLLQAVNTAVAIEKSTAKQKILSEETLLSAAYTALEKTILNRTEIPDGKKVVEETVEQIKKEVAVKHENADMKKALLKSLEKTVGQKIAETREEFVNEEIALAAVSAAMKSQGKNGILKEKLPLLIKSVFEKEGSYNSVLSKEKLLGSLQEVIDEQALLSDNAAMTAFKEIVEEKRMAAYETPLSDHAVLTAVDSAIEAVLSQEKDTKISKSSLLSTVTAELKQLKSQGTVSEGRVIAVIHAAIKAEVMARNEKHRVGEHLLEAFNSVIENKVMTKCPRLLSESEVLSVLDSALKLELEKNPQCSLSRSVLMEKINTAICEEKIKQREIILSENVLLECLQTAIEREVAVSGENRFMIDSLLGTVNSAIEKEKQAKKFAVLSEDDIVQAVSSAMESELIQNNKITVAKDELVSMVREAIREERMVHPERLLTEETLIKVVQSTIEKAADDGESHLLLKAFGSAVDVERSIAQKKPITEKAFLAIASSALETELSSNPETALTKDKLLSAIAETVDNEVTKRGELITEEIILAVAYSAIEKEALEKGESAAAKEMLLSGVDTIVERERDTKRVVNEEVIMEAIKSIADKFTLTPENRENMLGAVTSAMEKAKLTNEKLLDAVTNVVEDHFVSSDEIVCRKEAFMSALSSAVAQEQSAKHGTLMTKELLSAAVASAVEDQLHKNPGLSPITDKLLRAANSAVESKCSSITDQHLTEKTLLAAISASIESALGEVAETTSLDKVVDSMQRYLSENLDEVIVGTVNYMVANESAADKIKYAMNNADNTMQVIEKLSSVLNDNMGEAFQKLSASDPSLLKNVFDLLQEENLSTTDEATEALQKAIVGAVRQRSVDTLRTLMENSKDPSDGKDFKELLLQSVGLAKALGMNHVASVLLDVVSDSESHRLLASDETVIDILQRLTIMRQFAETKPELASALRQLISDPELAKRDPGIRELVRHSTALMSVPEEMLQSSADIPASLLFSDNTLAMEQFLARARRPRTLVIVKAGLQAVVPKEAARAVLTGQVPYAVLDEKGIKYFEPMHLFSTMKLPYYAAHCFSMYRCPEMEYESDSATPIATTPRESFSSAEDCFNQRKNVIMNGYSEKSGSRKFDKHFPVNRRLSELWRRPSNGSVYEGFKPFPAVCRTASGSRISDSSRKFLSDVYN